MRNLAILAIALVAATVPLLAGATPTTPEPGTVLLMGGGLGVLILIGRKAPARKK